MIIKCKMCGGDIAFNPGDTYGTCEFCGSTSTIPQAEDEGKLNRYNRANHFRRQCEFDKAVAAYEKLLEQDDTDAEAHWGAVISRYGIEYVEDPASKKRIPTCHRVQVASILADADYLSAVENAPDAASRDLYKAQAAEIAQIQKGILAISANEKPYDVFICYKETDENGQRTRDSQWAQDVYYGLTEQGYKVFFSRITLEDKLGQQYEPYIFAALNSARVMVVIGSKPEYFNAVWVKNEWSRYLTLMAKDRKRLLIPCYRGMDPYDLPQELSSLQSQDMGKIGFMQDLLRGVKKVLDAEKKPEQPKGMQQVVQTATPATGNNVAPLLRRAFMFLEDRDWNSANEYCEKVLDIEPENARAYMGKLMAELRVAKEDQLCNQQEPFEGILNYQKAIRFGDAQLKKKLEDDIRYIKDRNEHQRQAGIYSRGKDALRKASTCEECRSAADYFKTIPEFDGANEMLAECAKKEDSFRKELYNIAVNAMKAAGDDSDKWYDAKKKLTWRELNNYLDVAELRTKAAKQYDACLAAEKEAQRQKEEKARREAEAAAAKKKRNTILGVLAAVIVVAAFFVVTQVIIPNSNYNNAMALMNAGKYEEAITAFTAMNGYSDSAAKITACSKAISEREYQAAMALMNAGKYEEAITAFTAMNGYSDSVTQINVCKYKAAVALMNAGKYEEAITAFTALDGYSDSATQVKECKYLQAGALNAAGKYAEAYALYATISDYKDVENLVKTDYNLAAAAREPFTKVDNIVTYGHYEQDNNTSNGKEAIEWIVLKYDRTLERALLLSRYVLDDRRFDASTYQGWDKSEIRNWLNSTFLNNAFTSKEQLGIATTTVKTGNNAELKGRGGTFEYESVEGGADTRDKVFLLSFEEALKYSDCTTVFTFAAYGTDKMKATPTAYAVAQGASQSDSSKLNGIGCCSWWLRSPGNSSDCASSVYRQRGNLSTVYWVGWTSGIRPAFWLNLDSAAIY